MHNNMGWNNWGWGWNDGFMDGGFGGFNPFWGPFPGMHHMHHRRCGMHGCRRRFW